MTFLNELLRKLSSAPAARPRRRGGPRRRVRARGEDGFAIVAVLALLVIGLGLGAVAVAESLDSHDLANQDQRQRAAQQATDAGIQTQLYQQGEQNIMSTLSLGGGPLNLSTMLDCLIPQTSVTGQLTGTLLSASVFSSTAGVCPGSSTGGVTSGTIPVQALGHHTYYQSEFIPGASSLNGGTLFPKIVSLGWNDNGGNGRTVYSRQEVILAPIAPLRTLEAQGNLSITGISALGAGVSTAYGNISANGNLTTPTSFTMLDLDNLAGGILGSATYGGTYSGFLTIPPPVKVTQPVVRQPVSVSSGKKSCPDVADTCAYTAGVSGISRGYSAATNTFSISSGTATFAPGDYVLCSFNATGTAGVTAQPTASAPVRIFIDSPTSARCNSTVTNAALNQYNDKADANRGNFTAANGVANGLLGSNDITDSAALQIYVVGDQNTSNTYDNATTVTLGSDCNALLCTNPLTVGLILYAPTSSVSLYTGACVNLIVKVCTGGTFWGSIIGDNVNAQAATFSENLAIGNSPLYNGVEVYHPIQFVQCTAQPYKTVAGTTTTYTRLQADQTIDTTGC